MEKDWRLVNLNKKDFLLITCNLLKIMVGGYSWLCVGVLWNILLEFFGTYLECSYTYLKFLWNFFGVLYINF